jgi:hypothetical protein
MRGRTSDWVVEGYGFEDDLAVDGDTTACDDLINFGHFDML